MKTGSTCCVEELVTEVLKEGREAKVVDFDVARQWHPKVGSAA